MTPAVHNETRVRVVSHATAVLAHREWVKAGIGTPVITFTNDAGLRDYMGSLIPEAPPRRWPWLVLVAFIVGLLMGAWR